MGDAAAFPHVFAPTQLGTMRLRNRILVPPPHGSGIGNLRGTEEQAAQHIAYWESRAATERPGSTGCAVAASVPVVASSKETLSGTATRSAGWATHLAE